MVTEKFKMGDTGHHCMLKCDSRTQEFELVQY